MRTIYKYPLKITDRQTLPIKGLMSALHVGLDADQQPCIWCEVEVGERLYYWNGETYPG